MKKMHISLTLSLLAFTTLLQAETSTVNVSVPKPTEVNVTVPSVELVVDGVKVSKTSSKLTDTSSNSVVTQEPQKDLNNSQYEIIKGKRFPPNYHAKAEVKKSDEKVAAGEVKNDRIAAYLQAPLMGVDEATAKLQAAGFKVIATYKIDKKGKVTSIVFSDDALVKKASKPQRGFAANMRLLVDEMTGQISISNPIYVQKAFMQDDYDDAFAKETLKRLRDNFEGLQNSKDVVKFIRLPRYKFMNGMPVYEDMKEVATGTNEALLAKAHKSKKVIFEQKLSNGSVLLGVQLSRRTTKFVKKIGYQNAELLPYPVLIEDGKALMLAPKYYIAVMYPLLSMSEFMTIATVPGAINKDIDKIFR